VSARRGSKLAAESGRLQNFLVGTGLIAFGGCLGILVGSLLDAPRLLLNRFYKPVETVSLESVGAEDAAGSGDALELSAYRALQEEKQDPEEPELPVVSAIRPEPAAPAPEVPKPTPPAELPQAAAAPVKKAVESKEALIASIKKTTAHPVPELSPLPEAPPAAAAKPKPAAAPAASKPAPEAAKPPRAATRRLVVQVAAYADAPTALRVVSDLQASGFDAYVSPISAPGAYPHRVRVRPALQQAAAELAKTLKTEGYSVWTTRE